MNKDIETNTIRLSRLSKTDHLQPLVQLYLNGDASIKELYSHSMDIKGIGEMIKAREGFEHREELVGILERQNGSIVLSESSRNNLEELRSSNTFTVTTGHQCGLFTGPLYFIYKIASTISLAERLKKEFPGKNFVPIFWLHGDDQDIDEVDHTYVHAKKIKWEHGSTNRTPVGRLKSKGVSKAIEELEKMLKGEYTSDWIKKLNTAYNLPTISDAIRYLANDLFGEYGLLILDQDDAELKRHFIPIIKKEVEENFIRAGAKSSAKIIRSTGNQPQVNAREFNIMYVSNEGRNKLESNEDGFKSGSKKFGSKEGLFDSLASEPGQWSTNVLSRPLFQEIVLPNLAYIGGGAEISYWLQLKSAFEALDLELPVLIPRPSALLIWERPANWMKEWNYTEEDIFRDADELVREYVENQEELDIDVDYHLKRMKEGLEGLKAESLNIDKGMEQMFDAMEQQLDKMTEKVKDKLVKAVKRKNETSVDRIYKWKDLLFPKGNHQERVENISVSYSEHGRKLIEQLVETMDPLESRFNIYYL